jgi:hypothetical protein
MIARVRRPMLHFPFSILPEVDSHPGGPRTPSSPFASEFSHADRHLRSR